jgi:hypothetical protein
MAALIAQLSGGREYDRPEKWSEERLDLEIAAECERLMLVRWTSRAGGFGSALYATKYLFGK